MNKQKAIKRIRISRWFNIASLFEYRQRKIKEVLQKYLRGTQMKEQRNQADYTIKQYKLPGSNEKLNQIVLKLAQQRLRKSKYRQVERK